MEVRAGRILEKLLVIKNRTKEGRQEEPQFINCSRNEGGRRNFYCTRAREEVVFNLARRNFMRTVLLVKRTVYKL